MVIECDNMFYVSNFNSIGGVETFIHELVRKYNKYDILVVYKKGDMKQLQRLRENVRTVKFVGQKFKCKRAFFNYDTDIIESVMADEYIQIIHAMFKTQGIKQKVNPKITKFLGVSKGACDEYEELTGIRPKLFRSVLTVTKDEKHPALLLISATRLTKEKGKSRMIMLADMLDKASINYLWLVFTNDKEKIENPNIVYMQPNLNIRPFIASIKGKGYGVQLSDCEGDCYFTRECEALGVPLLVTPVPSFKEQGLVDGKNCYFLPFDMKDIDVDKIVNNIPTYEPYIKKDDWAKQIVAGESQYQKDLKTTVSVRAVKNYFDTELGRRVKLHEVFETTKARSYYLVEAGVCEVLDDTKEQ